MLAPTMKRILPHETHQSASQILPSKTRILEGFPRSGCCCCSSLPSSRRGWQQLLVSRQVAFDDINPTPSPCYALTHKHTHEGIFPLRRSALVLCVDDFVECVHVFEWGWVVFC
uniref:(northern house mosquito) hypothetical protein n=1 Tax=Culex pipiens TaxID=7175 RepID=A0A8D8A426_CULPI